MWVWTWSFNWEVIKCYEVCATYVFGAINLVNLQISISDTNTEEKVILTQNTDFWSILKLLEFLLFCRLFKVHKCFFILRGHNSIIPKRKEKIFTIQFWLHRHSLQTFFFLIARYDVATVRLFTEHSSPWYINHECAHLLRCCITMDSWIEAINCFCTYECVC